MLHIGRVDFADVSAAQLNLQPVLKVGHSLNLSIIGTVYAAPNSPPPPQTPSPSRLQLGIVNYPNQFSSFALMDEVMKLHDHVTDWEWFFLGQWPRLLSAIFQVDCTVAWESRSMRAICHGHATYAYGNGPKSTVGFQCHGVTDDAVKDVSALQIGCRDHWMAGRAVAQLVDS
jgi:hypothetical protein